MTHEAGQLAPVKVGDVLAGKYSVESVLGSGGMGVVVAAKHLHLGERVAIKFLLPQAMKKPEVVQRFLKEGRAAFGIKSEHVARVFDVGTLESGAPYMVMELLEGADLSSILKTKGQLPIPQAVEHTLQACEAIAEAHSLGIIHRDLKPANLFVTRRADGSTSVKVIDFGISKVPEAEGEVEMTKTDVMMGSPVYMAPEQMISARDVDVRADVWSLGVILFYLVMGSQPFRGNTVTQLYASILEGPPKMRDARPDIPPGFESAVIKCLLAQPKERWSNVAEFALAIAEYGPPTARVSAERVTRTLGVVSAPESAPIAPIPGSISPTDLVGAPGVTSQHAAQPVSEPSQSDADAGSKAATTGPTGTIIGPMGPQNTDGSWGGTQGPVVRRKPKGLLIAIPVALLCGVAVAIFVLIVPSGPPAGGSASSSVAATTETAPDTPATGGATVTPAPSPVTSTPSATSAEPTASASPTVTPTASASASASSPVFKPSPSVRPAASSRPSATTTTPKTDLFSDPH